MSGLTITILIFVVEIKSSFALHRRLHKVIANVEADAVRVVQMVRCIWIISVNL